MSTHDDNRGFPPGYGEPSFGPSGGQGGGQEGAGYGADPRGAGRPDPRLADPRFADPRYPDPRGAVPRSVDPRAIDPRTVDPRQAPARPQDPRLADPRFAALPPSGARPGEPWPNDQRLPQPRNADPRPVDPRPVDPRLADPRLADPRLSDPRLADPRYQAARGPDPRSHDPRMTDPRAQDPRLADPRYADPRQAHPSQQAPGSYGQPAPRGVSPQSGASPAYGQQPPHHGGAPARPTAPARPGAYGEPQRTEPMAQRYPQDPSLPAWPPQPGQPITQSAGSRPMTGFGPADGGLPTAARSGFQSGGYPAAGDQTGASGAGREPFFGDHRPQPPAAQPPLSRGGADPRYGEQRFADPARSQRPGQSGPGFRDDPFLSGAENFGNDFRLPSELGEGHGGDRSPQARMADAGQPAWNSEGQRDFGPNFGAPVAPVGIGAGDQPGYGEHADHDDDATRDDRPKRRRGLVLGGAVASLAAVTAAGYYLVIGDPGVGGKSGQPPVIEARKAPVKVAPADPGGREFANENRKVYDRIGPSAPPRDAQPIDARGLSPVRPVEAKVGAQPGGAEAPQQAAAQQSAAQQEDAGGPRKVKTLVVLPDGTIKSQEQPAEPAQAPVRVEGIGLNVGAPKPAQPPVVQAAKPAQVPPAQVQVAQAARPAQPAQPAARPAQPAQPAARPAQPAQPPVVQAARPAQPTQPAQAAPRPAQPAQAAPAGAALQQAAAPKVGQYVVQLASHGTEQEAMTAFGRLKGSYGTVLASETPLVQRADLGDKGVWYRLFVGKGTKGEADELCSALKTAGMKGCFVRRFE